MLYMSVSSRVSTAIGRIKRHCADPIAVHCTLRRDLAKMEKVGDDSGDGDGKCETFVSAQGEVMQVRSVSLQDVAAAQVTGPPVIATNTEFLCPCICADVIV